MKFKKSKKSDEACILKELVIEWDANTGRPKRVFMRQQAFAERGPVKFLGNPSFYQNMANKKYFWCSLKSFRYSSSTKVQITLSKKSLQHVVKNF